MNFRGGSLVTHLRLARKNLHASTARVAAARIESLESTLEAIARNCPHVETRAIAQSALDRALEKLT